MISLVVTHRWWRYPPNHLEADCVQLIHEILPRFCVSEGLELVENSAEFHFTSGMFVQARETKIIPRYTGEAVEVPDSPVATLMYCLDCVYQMLRYPEDETIPARFRIYDNYSDLTLAELKQLIQTAREWNPDFMVSRGLFARAPTGNSACIDKSNKFVEFTKIERTASTDGSVTLAELTVQVMYFTESWVEENFSSPCLKVDEEITQRRVCGMGQKEKSEADRASITLKTAEMILGWTNGQLALEYTRKTPQK
jgi:hypothetical protein